MKMNTTKKKKKKTRKTETESNQEEVKKSKSTSTIMLVNMSIGLIAIIVGLLFCYFPQEGYSLSSSSSSSIEVSSNGNVVESNDNDVRTVQCTNDTLSQFLHEDFVQGMHLICFHPTMETNVDDGDDNNDVRMEMILYPGIDRKSVV